MMNNISKYTPAALQGFPKKELKRGFNYLPQKVDTIEFKPQKSSTGAALLVFILGILFFGFTFFYFLLIGFSVGTFFLYLFILFILFNLGS